MNGFFTVIGTILALTFAMMVGSVVVFLMAGVCDLAAWLVLGFSAKSGVV